MTKRFSWLRTLRKIGTIGRAIDVKAANANQLYRRHRLEELDIFDGSRFGFRPRAAGFWGRWGQYRASWWIRSAPRSPSPPPYASSSVRSSPWYCPASISDRPDAARPGPRRQKGKKGSKTGSCQKGTRPAL